MLAPPFALAVIFLKFARAIAAGAGPPKAE